MQRDQDDVALQRPADRRRLSCGQMPINPSHHSIHQCVFFFFLISTYQPSSIYRIHATMSPSFWLSSKSAPFRGWSSDNECYTKAVA